MPTKKKCYTKQCNYDFDLDLYIATETQIQCTPYEKLPICAQVCICDIYCQPLDLKNNLLQTWLYNIMIFHIYILSCIHMWSVKFNYFIIIHLLKI